MSEALVRVEIAAPVEKLWSLLADFGEIGWMQGVSKVEVKGSGVGMVREIYAIGAAAPVVEVLESKDEAARQIAYTIPENIPLPVDDYHATCVAVDLGDGRSRLDWGCTFTPKGTDEASAKAQVEAMYNVLISWVKGELEG
jgi:hypothetical protein